MHRIGSFRGQAQPFMNRIAFDLRLVKASEEPYLKDYFALNIRVDDRDLLEYVRDTERPFAAAEGHPELAGKYEALPAFMALESFASKGSDKVSVYDCECGCSGCWPLRVRISVSEKSVIWSEFEQPHRGPKSRTTWWRYDKLGPFAFERGQYELAVSMAASELRDRQQIGGSGPRPRWS